MFAPRTLSRLCATFLVSSYANLASAQSAAAEALFRAGRDAISRGDFAKGCALLREAGRIEPSVGTELNLAVCEEREGNLTRALEMYRGVAATLPSDDERTGIAMQRVRELESRIGHVVLKSADPLPTDARVFLDALELGTAALGIAVPVDPGHHRVELRVPGHVPRVLEFGIVGGARRELLLTPGEKLAGTRDPHPADPESSGPAARSRPAPAPRGVDAPLEPATTLSPWPVLLLGTSAASLAIGTISGLAVLREKATMDIHCTEAGACAAPGVDAAQRGKVLASLSTGAFVVAVASGAAGGWLLWPSAQRRSKTGTLQRPSVKIGIGSVSLAADF